MNFFFLLLPYAHSEAPPALLDHCFSPRFYAEEKAEWDARRDPRDPHDYTRSLNELNTLAIEWMYEGKKGKSTKAESQTCPAEGIAEFVVWASKDLASNPTTHIKYASFTANIGDKYVGQHNFQDLFRSVHGTTISDTGDHGLMVWLELTDSAKSRWKSSPEPVLVTYDDATTYGVYLMAASSSFSLTNIQNGLLLPDETEASASDRLVDTVGVAPVSLRMRFSPFDKIQYGSFFAEVSALAIGSSGAIANQDTEQDSSKSFAPVSVWGGLDYWVPIQEQSIVVFAGGGFQVLQLKDAASGSSTFRLAPGFTVGIQVPLIVMKRQYGRGGVSVEKVPTSGSTVASGSVATTPTPQSITPAPELTKPVASGLGSAVTEPGSPQ